MRSITLGSSARLQDLEHGGNGRGVLGELLSRVEREHDEPKAGVLVEHTAEGAVLGDLDLAGKIGEQGGAG